MKIHAKADLSAKMPETEDNIMAELWDLYNEDREKIGLTMERGNPSPKVVTTLRYTSAFLTAKGVCSFSIGSRSKRTGAMCGV